MLGSLTGSQICFSDFSLLFDIKYSSLMAIVDCSFGRIGNVTILKKGKSDLISDDDTVNQQASTVMTKAISFPEGNVAVFLSWARQHFSAADSNSYLSCKNQMVLGCIAESAVMRKAASLAFSNKKRSTVTGDIIECLGKSMSTQNRDKGKAPMQSAKASWDRYAVKVFVEGAMEQINNGERKGTSLTKKGWDVVAKTNQDGNSIEKCLEIVHQLPEYFNDKDVFYKCLTVLRDKEIREWFIRLKTPWEQIAFLGGLIRDM
ncbi:hypothetical protein RJT34_14168 [Clitoria ternatea]|uniref:Uncharacterized protein n=1 Tax=Clitoria ternatea TaxID=43366 RepID=A0AAN9JS00_CLITE